MSALMPAKEPPLTIVSSSMFSSRVSLVIDVLLMIPGGRGSPALSNANGSGAGDAADLTVDVQGDFEAEDLELAAAGVDDVVVLDRGPLHSAADGVERGSVEFANFGVHVCLPSLLARAHPLATTAKWPQRGDRYRD